jgi:CrcB protein
MGPHPGPGADVFARREPSRDAILSILAAVAAGGALGAAARYLASERWPTAPGGLPLTTAAINVVGSAAIGVLMVVVSERWPHRRLVRPFLGTGVLGGFTTFSTYAVDVQHLATGGQPLRAALYLVATPVLALLAAAVGSRAARMLYSRRSR